MLFSRFSHIGRPRNCIPYVARPAFKTLGAELTRPYHRIDSSLLVKYGSYLLTSRESYTLAWWCRGTTCARFFVRRLLRLYRGRLWRGVRLSKWHIGQKGGALARSRVLAIFRQKATRKKKPTAVSTANQKRLDAKIEQVRQVKAGQRKRTIQAYNPAFEAQYGAVSG